MKKTKKLLTGILSAALIMSTASFAIATDITSDTENIAYMDIAKVPELEDEILAARKKIIFGDQAWTVDGQVSIVNEDGTVEKLPEFSDLFPGWDIPEDNEKCPPQSRAVRYSGNVYVPAVDNNVNAPKFYSFNAFSSVVKITALTLPGNKYNVGITNEDTYESAAWVPNICLGQTAAVNRLVVGTRYSVRVSTYDMPGWGVFEVDN